MNLSKITIIIEPIDRTHGIEHLASKSTSGSLGYDRLASVLNEQTLSDVILIDSYLKSAPRDGLILLAPTRLGIDFESSFKECNPELQITLPQRLILLNIIRSETYKLLNKYNLIAAVEDLDYRYWWQSPERLSGRQEIHGLVSVAEEMGAEYQLVRGKYCYISGNVAETLPSFLMRYLKDYGRLKNIKL